MSKLGSGLESAGSNLAAFDRMEDKVNKMLDEADAMAELNAEKPDSLEALAKKYDVSMPIVELVNRILFDNLPAKEAVSELMFRDKKIEHSDLPWS